MVPASAPGDHPDGGQCDTIVVENDRLDRKAPAREAEPRDVELLDEQQIVEIAREAGIVGMGGAGFPLYAKPQGAGGTVEVECGENNLLEGIAADPAVGLSLEDVQRTIEPSRYVGRAPEQVDAFLSQVVNPILEEYRELLGEKAEINV